MAEEYARKKPQRVQLACLSCRQGKLRCNRESPACDQCIKRAREPTCTYTERGMRYNAAKHKAEFMREKVDRLETFVNRLRQSNTVAEGTSATPRSTNGSDEASSLVPAHLTQATGQLRLTDSGGIQFVGPSHWESIIEDIAEVKAYFDLQDGPESSLDDDIAPTLRSNLLSADIVLGVKLGYTKDEILTYLPNKATTDRMIAAWFGTKDSLCTITHVPTFQAEYTAFWQRPADVSPAWLALLLSIAGVGAEYLGQVRREADTLVLAEDLRRLTTHALVIAEYSRPQPYSVETLLLHIKSLLLKSNDVTSELYLLLGTTTRLCTQGGFHRDPRHNLRLAPLCAEMRRRVWASVCAFDIKMCYQLGLVSVINLMTQDASAPTNYTDGDLTMDPLPTPRPLHDMTGITISLMYNKISHIFGDIIYSTHAATKPSTAEVTNLNERLLQARKEFPPQLRMRSFTDSFLDPLELKLGRYGLEFAHLKAQCVLYQRYMGNDDHRAEQTQCYNAAIETVRLQVELLREAQPGSEVEAALPFLRGYLHDFNLAAMLLCSGIKRNCQWDGHRANHKKSANVAASLLEGCRLWEARGTNSVKARSAIRAMLRFVEQLLARDPTYRALACDSSNMDSETTYGGAPKESAGPSLAGPVNDAIIGDPESLAGLYPDTTVRSSWPVVDQDPAGVYFNSYSPPRSLGDDPDMLFQELLGSDYTMVDNTQASWP